MAAIDQPEWRLQHYGHLMLVRVVLEPCHITGVEHAEAMKNKSPQSIMRLAQRRKARGIIPGHLDHTVVQAPLYSQIEWKYGDGRLSPTQSETIRILNAKGFPATCCWSVWEAFEHIRDAGFRLHGNAENIAREIEIRWRAADEAKRGGAAKKKKRSSMPRGMRRAAHGVPEDIDMERLV